MTRLESRRLTLEEQADFLAAQDEAYVAKLRRMSAEARMYPELMATYGFAVAAHPTTTGLMAYRHDELRQQHCREIRAEIARIASGEQFRQEVNK